MITFNAVLSNKNQVAPGVFFLTFKNEAGPPLEFKPGQYVVATIPSGKGLVKRLYSIASSPAEKPFFNLLVKRLEKGVGSVYLSNLVPGNTVVMSGPAGLFSLQENPTHKIFLATGTGLAPILSFISTHGGIQVSLFWGVQTSKDVFFLDFFKKIKINNPLFDYHICLSREIVPTAHLQEQDVPVFYSGRINEAMEFYMGSTFTSHGRNVFEYYICGSRTVVDSLRAQLLSLGVEKGRLYFEKY